MPLRSNVVCLCDERPEPAMGYFNLDPALNSNDNPSWQ